VNAKKVLLAKINVPLGGQEPPRDLG